MDQFLINERSLSGQRYARRPSRPIARAYRPRSPRSWSPPRVL